MLPCKECDPHRNIRAPESHRASVIRQSRLNVPAASHRQLQEQRKPKATQTSYLGRKYCTTFAGRTIFDCAKERRTRATELRSAAKRWTCKYYVFRRKRCEANHLNTARGQETPWYLRFLLLLPPLIDCCARRTPAVVWGCLVTFDLFFVDA